MSGWEFRLLGPLEARFDGRPVHLAGPKQRSVLAMLLTDVGRVVSTTSLIAGLWGEELPSTSTATLHVHVGNVRKALRQACGADADQPLHTRAPGYVVDVPATTTDLHQFRHLVGAARSADVDVATRARLLRDALDLWRGPALADLAEEPFAESLAVALDEERVTGLEARIEADLALGRHAELVGELRGLTETHPLHERFWGQLMLALYRCGRQAEALSAYGRARGVLVDELGLEPGAELRRLEMDVLRQAPRLAWHPPVVAEDLGGQRTTVVRRSNECERVGVVTWSGGRVELSDTCTIGRASSNTIVLDDEEVSRHHAVIRWRADGFVIADQRSTNGTCVGDQRVDERVLADGNVIRIGDTHLRFTESDRSSGPRGDRE